MSDKEYMRKYMRKKRINGKCQIFEEDDHRWPLRAKAGDYCWCGAVRWITIQKTMPSLVLDEEEK